MSSPTTRSLALLRKEDYIAEVVERYNSFTRTRKDLFNWIDVVAVCPTHILGVQTTSANNASARFNKAGENEALIEWLQAGGKLQIHGWKSKKVIASTGREMKKWVCNRWVIGIDDNELVRERV
jgi:hypothetical protein